MSAKLTSPQADLLEEIRLSSTGGLWITTYRRYWRTAKALEERGLIRRTDAYRSEVFFEPVATAPHTAP